MALQTYKIPLTNIPQYFNITLVGVEYQITCRWNNASEGGWFIDIANASTNTMLVTDIPLVTGLDILEPFGYLGIKGRMVVFTDNDATAVPTLKSLGVNSNLYFITETAE